MRQDASRWGKETAMTARSRLCKHLGILALPLVALGLIATAHPARAGQDAWTPFGPGEGALQSLTASPRGELYVTARFSATEIWQLPLPTVPWRWRNNGLGLPAVTALAVDPKSPNSLWAVSRNNIQSIAQSVFHSNDGGGSWTPVFTGDIDFQVAHLWVAPARRSVVLLAETGNGAPRQLLRSADGGASWTPVLGVFGPVAAPPDQPNVVFASAADGLGVVRSTDGALTFHPTGSLPVEAGDTLRALHATFGRGASVFVSFLNAGLFRSVDSGRRWSRVGFLHDGPGALASEPKAPGTIYATNFSGLYASQKNGKSGSFRELAAFFPILVTPEPTALAAAPGGPYFLAGPDLVRYDPKSRADAPVAKTGIESFGVAELRFHTEDPSLLALRRYTGCIHDSCDFRTLLSTDGGKTFKRLGVQFLPRSFDDVTDLAFDPVSTTRWITALGGLATLTENGASRQVLFGGVTAVEISEGGILLAGGLEGVQISENDGASWQTALSKDIPTSPEHPLGGSRRVVDLVVNPFATDRVIARTLESFATGVPLPSLPVPAIYRSSDGGRTWTKILDGSADVEFVPGAPASLYILVSAAGGTELRRSDDDGVTSQLVHTFAISEAVSDVATDPSAPLDLYAASMNGVLQSRDGGVTWEPTPGDFNAWGTYRQFIGHVQVHPTQRGHLFAVPAEGGLFENQLTN
jgi:photosystem II stability/assembly factor-like uncharacterized protein